MIDFVEWQANRGDPLPVILDIDAMRPLGILAIRQNTIGNTVPANLIDYAGKYSHGINWSQIVFWTIYYDASNLAQRASDKIPLLFCFDELIKTKFTSSENYGIYLLVKDNFIAKNSFDFLNHNHHRYITKKARLDYASNKADADIQLNIGLPIYEIYSVLLFENQTKYIVKHIIKFDIVSKFGLLANTIVSETGICKKNALIEANQALNDFIWSKKEGHQNEINEIVAMMMSNYNFYQQIKKWWQNRFYYLIWKKLNNLSGDYNFGERRYNELANSYTNSNPFPNPNAMILDEILTTLCRKIIIWMGEL